MKYFTPDPHQYLQCFDVILVFILQDGFFDGELIDGRRGLVPSNFIEKVAGMVFFWWNFIETHVGWLIPTFFALINVRTNFNKCKIGNIAPR